MVTPREWFAAHLLDDVLPRWLAASPTPSGRFVPRLDRAWRPDPDSPATLVSQARMLFNFATGFRLTGDARYAGAVGRGARYLVEQFADPVHGGFRWSLGPDHAPLDSHKSAYGHAFVIFGLAHAFVCTGDGASLQAAAETADLMRDRFTDGYGGLIPTLSRAWDDTDATRTQNPIMHLFEALLALACEAGCDEAASMARATAEWVVGRLVRRADGALPELYTPEWTELSEAEGGRLDVGHQFEWAYLLSRAVERGLWKAPEAERMLATGERLLGVGMAAGYDEGGGGVWSPAAPDGRVMSRAKGWWEQCEAARAMHHYARLRGRSDLAEPFQRTMAFCRAHLVDPQHGGWYMRVEPDGSVRNRDKGNEWKLDYHVVGLCAEALEVSPGT